MDLAYILEYTLASLAQEDPDGVHHLCLITDRLGDEGISAVGTINQFRRKAGLECRFLVMGVGQRYNRGNVAAFCQADGLDFRHVDNPQRLSEVMISWVKKDSYVKE